MNDTRIAQVKVPEGKQFIQLNGRKYPVTDLIEVNNRFVPVLDIPIMSDERWNKIARSPENQALLRGVQSG